MIQIKRGAATVATVNPTSSSNMSKAVMGEEQITLVWEAPAFVPFYLGDFITFEGSNWTLNKLPTVKKLSGKTWQYNGVFQSTKYELIKAMYLLFDNTDTLPSGEFPLTGTADTFMQLLVANLNRVVGSAVWSVGQVIENTDYKNLTFSNEDCLSVLGRLADEFETEYHVSNHVIHLKKISTNREVTLQYGSTLYDIERSSVDSSDVCTRLYAFGSTKNLASDYRGGNSPLRLPDANGDYIESNVNLYGVIERAKTFDAIYPRLSSGGAGVITSVGDEFTFYDSHLDFNVNDYLLDGTTAKVHFNTGECAGYDFEIALYNHTTKKFVIIANTQENDFTLPSADLKPAVGDKYVLIDIVMPPAYLAAAEAELLAKAQEFISQNSTPKVAYKTTFSAIYAKQNLQSIECGDTVTVYDEDMGIEEQIRIIKLQKGLTDFWTVQFDLANTVTATRLERIEGNVSAVENTVIVTNQRVNRNNLRAYQWTKELQGMVFDPDGYFDPQNIKPLSIETTMVSVSAKSQIFQLSSLLQPNYAGNPQVMQWSAGLLTHFTIADNAITEWIISQGSITITGENQTKPLYIYARCLRSGITGDIYLAPVALKFNEGSTYYYFLIGVLHTPISSVRGISLNYGQTTINGQFIQTGIISSIDGATYFNLNTGEIGGNIKFKSTDGSYKTVDQAIGDINLGGRNYLVDSKSLIKSLTTSPNKFQDLGFPASTKMSLSFYAKRNSGSGNILHTEFWGGAGATNFTIGATFAKFETTMTTHATGTGLHFWMTDAAAVVEFKEIMVVIGDKAFDWSPSPESVQVQIDESKALLADITNDNKLTPDEKKKLKPIYDSIVSEFNLLYNQADDVGAGAFDPFWDNGRDIQDYLSPILANLETTSTVDGALIRNLLSGYYTQRAGVITAINNAINISAKSLDFVKSAIENGSAEFQGGLGLINLLFMKNLLDQVTGGMSGLDDDNVGFWTGGTYAQALADAARAFKSTMAAAALDRKDGAGHRAFGNFAWNAAGDVYMKGMVEALSGKFGLLKIADASIVGDHLKITDAPLDSFSVATSPRAYTIPAKTQAVQLQPYYTDELAHGVVFETNEINIETATTLPAVYLRDNYPAYGYPYIYSANSPISCILKYKVQIINNGDIVAESANTWNVGTPFSPTLHSITVAATAVAAGTVKVRATITMTSTTGFSDWNFAEDLLICNPIISSGGTSDITVSAYVKRTMLAGDGFYSFANQNRYMYLRGAGDSNDLFELRLNNAILKLTESLLKFTGAVDIPAGLGGASINSSGIISANWGKIAGTGQVVKSGSNYTITHNIGDTDYSLILTPISTNVPYFSSKSANTVVVTCAGGFDFVLLRTK